MNIETRSKFREEAKAIALYRRDVKQKSKSLYREADVYLKKYLNKPGAKRAWNDEDWKLSVKKSNLAESLRHSKKDYARALNIALGLLRGRSYKDVEHKCNEVPNVSLIHSIIETFVGTEESNKWTEEVIREFIEA